MEHKEQTCSTCKYFQIVEHGFYVCKCGQQQLFKTTLAEPDGYCVFHEPNIKTKKK